jgi:hypothetical protein
MKEKQAATREYRSRYQKAAKKEKRALPDEFARLTGRRRKSAIRLLSAGPVREVLVTVDGKPVKLKPEKKRPANRKGKRACADEAIAAPRLIRTFFRYKRAGNGASAKSSYAAADGRCRPMAGLSHHRGNGGKTEKDKPRGHRPVSETRPGSAKTQGEKPCQTPSFAEKPYPRAFYSGEGRKTPGFRQTGTVGL